MRRGDNGGVIPLILSLALALLGFLGCFLALGWPLWLSGAIALALYGAVQLLSPAVLSGISERGRRLPGGVHLGAGSQDAYDSAVVKVQEMREVLPRVKDSALAQAGGELTTQGEEILKHLRENPRTFRSPSTSSHTGSPRPMTSWVTISAWRPLASPRVNSWRRGGTPWTPWDS